MTGDNVLEKLVEAVELLGTGLTKYFTKNPRAPRPRTFSLVVGMQDMRINIGKSSIREDLHDHLQSDAVLKGKLEALAQEIRPDLPELVRFIEALAEVETFMHRDDGIVVKVASVDFSINGLVAHTFPMALDRLSDVSEKFHREDMRPETWLILQERSGKLEYSGLKVDAGTQEEASLLLAAINCASYGVDAIKEGDDEAIRHWLDKTYLIREPEGSVADYLIKRRSRVMKDPTDMGPS